MLKAIISTALLLITQTAPAEAFIYPRDPVLKLGRENLHADLLKKQENEVKALHRKLPKNLTPAERNSATHKALQERNQKLITELNAYSPEPSPGQKDSIDAAEAQSLHESIHQHPIVSEKGAAKYDGAQRHIGYCFGTATYVHAEALRRKLNPQAIGKVFAVGRLFYLQSPWEFHVATVIRKTGGGWWAIDGYGEKPLPLEEWMARTSTWTHDNPSEIRFYFSDAVKFQPTSGPYSDDRLYSPYYKGYFDDLRKWFTANPVSAPGAQ